MTRAELEQDCDFLGLIIMQVLTLIVTLMLTLMLTLIVTLIVTFETDDQPFPEPAQEGNIWSNSRASPGQICQIS